MYNVTKFSGWLGADVVDLARIGGRATAMARPRHGQAFAFGDGQTRWSGVRQLA